MDGHIVRCGIISFCLSAATPDIVKALLAVSPSHVRRALARTGRYLFVFYVAVLYKSNWRPFFASDGIAS